MATNDNHYLHSKIESNTVIMKINGIYLTQCLYPNTNGGTLHNYGIVNYLQKLININVYSHLENRYDLDDARKNYSNEKFDVHFYHTRKGIRNIRAKVALIEPVDRGMLEDVRNCIRKDNVKFIFYVIRMYGYITALKREFPDINYVYISHNCEYLNIIDDLKRYDEIHNVSKIKHATKLIRSNIFISVEKKCLQEATVIFSITQYDSVKLSRRYNIPIDKFVTSKPMIQYNSIRSKNAWDDNHFSHKIIIVGNMSWYPTAEGAIWFTNAVFPLLSNKDPKCQLYIVGANPPEYVRNLSDLYRGVTITGYVDSVDEYYKNCDIAVIPVFSGTGAKIKALEAVGLHIPAVVSEYAAKDYEGMSNAVLTARDYDAQGFADQIEKLLNSETARKTVSEKEDKYYSDYMSDSKPVKEYMENMLNEFETASHPS